VGPGGTSGAAAGGRAADGCARLLLAGRISLAGFPRGGRRCGAGASGRRGSGGNLACKRCHGNPGSPAALRTHPRGGGLEVLHENRGRRGKRLGGPIVPTGLAVSHLTDWAWAGSRAASKRGREASSLRVDFSRAALRAIAALGTPAAAPRRKGAGTDPLRRGSPERSRVSHSTTGRASKSPVWPVAGRGSGEEMFGAGGAQRDWAGGRALFFFSFLVPLLFALCYRQPVGRGRFGPWRSR